ncbi:phosphatidylethanolamine-binding protein [Cupriavidus necator]|uniref:Phosphatidylethanolamine-binding protein n=1 Tax=Cupriavidus necator TaxID=106590 RepID=A0A1U9UM71_CUPNE|nr:YbhB/YbcL family Raf kinase inhibitor-like protein [Cupriavidus necator]AQV93886.1 phosphatidylethanolamine-binding protein [Cupriavidus necator]
MKIASAVSAPVAGALMCLYIGNACAVGMQVSSTSYTEGATIASLYAHDGVGGDQKPCGGKGVSPQVSWSRLPAGAKSVAILMYDMDGNAGLGVSHWVAYNIAANRGQLKEGEGKADGPGVAVGKNVLGEAAYRGPCAPAGETPHHYAITVIATDLAPNLPAGMTRDELMAALKGHALEAQSLVGRFGR